MQHAPRRRLLLATAVLALVALGPGLGLGLASSPASAADAENGTKPAAMDYSKGGKLDLVASWPDRQITGVTVAGDGRIFVNLPRWNKDVPISVAELKPDGELQPYPDADWNGWRNTRHLSPKDHFVCVQSVVADRHGSLWVVDPAAPGMSGPVKGGPKLVKIDLKTNKVSRTYPIDDAVAPPGSYLNDIRFSPDGGWAYLTDSGIKGALVVVDLKSGDARRVLDGDPSTQADQSLVPKVDGHELRRPDGRTLQSAADGIALSPDGETIYWQALTGKTLYSIPTGVLRDASLKPSVVADKVRKVGTTHPADGLWIDGAGKLYVSNPAANSVEMGEPGGDLKVLVQDDRLRWPDTFSQAPDGTIYISGSHIQDSPWFKPDAKATPSELWKISPK
ncbi:Major royal jelly protein [Faunimonas pinastri]|uniref:Major royal jelly protein n=1 Tax=Faunimonas pinastri TaxID=1855383 RepID=A0A1H9MGC7_9HYPH|nr:L-dopachrome tautomerase-related protein [Faunimonas pinastri]SER22714.1 Major royal jelly protein [Faunimonas pinastri]